MLEQSPRSVPVRFELKAYDFDCGIIPSVPLLASSVALARIPGRPCCHEAQLKLCSINLAKREDEPEIQDGGTWPRSSEAKQQTVTSHGFMKANLHEFCGGKCEVRQSVDSVNCCIHTSLTKSDGTSAMICMSISCAPL